jgi:Tfp pilus assembly protein PilN
MRAINLIPADDRRGTRGSAPRSGSGVYILLGALALLVVAASAYALAGKSVTDKRDELARVNHEAAAAEARANAATDYTRFASLRQRREDTVRQLAASRFDWSHALHEVARVLPTNAWLTQVTASTTPGSAGGGDPLRSAIPVPALEIQGCTTSQASVARVMARLRLIDGVQHVSLSTADKGAKKPKSTLPAAPSSGTAGGSGDCRGTSNHFPAFSVVVFYEATTPAPGAAAGAAQTVASTSTPASTTTPSSSSSSHGGTTP